MADAMILKAPGVIADRTGLEKFPDIQSDLLIDINPANISGYLSGQRVIDFVAGGNGSVRDRTFDERWNADWFTPQWISSAKDGLPSLRFDGSSTIQNTAPGDLPQSRDQPITIVWVGRLTSAPAAGQLARISARTFATAGAGFVTIALDTDGSLVMVSEGKDEPGSWLYGDSPAPSSISQWRCLVAVFNGGSSLLSVNGSLQRVVMHDGMFQGLALGVRTTATVPGDGMVGDTLRQQVFTRAFTDSDIREMWLSMQETYGL